MVESAPRRRKPADEDKKSASGNSADKKHKDKILSSRYNPKKSDKGAVLSHSNLGIYQTCINKGKDFCCFVVVVGPFF